MPMKFFCKKKTSTMRQIEKCLAYIHRRTSFKPEIGLILGTGLGDLAKRIKAEKIFKYEELPFFPKTTVQSHSGKLILGELGGKKVAAMEGRFHFYEGYSLEEVTFPVRVLRQLGAKILVVSNAARVESAAAQAPSGAFFQFERLGYFTVDPDSSPGRPVFNRAVSLRDSWAKIEKKAGGRR